MTEYIEREALRDALYDADAITMTGVKILNQFPSSDVAQVRRGRWEEMHYEGGILDGTNFDRCTACGYERVFENPALKTVFRYCPSCGAVMEDADA